MEHTEIIEDIPTHRHFSTGYVAGQFNTEFLSENHCRTWVLRQLHPATTRCPNCGEPFSDVRRLARFWNMDRLQCAYCGRFFTALTGTLLSGTHLTFSQIVLLCLLIETGLTAPRIAKIIGEDPETVRLWKFRFSHIEATNRL
jgi:hypothetical protein